jgi:predicted O-linked N-acetylglucosamine transferase (SPINDLY family)
MILRNRALGSRRTRDAVRREFERRGVDPQRLDLRGPLEHGRFLATYDEIDIALDTFPYNGATTTMEAIWQGVPVVTFRGDRWASRQCASLLRAGGLGRFVCDDQAAFEDLAVALASSGTIAQELTELRLEMRARLRASSVCDTLGFARTIEQFYTEMAANAAERYGGDQVSARASAAAFPSS